MTTKIDLSHLHISHRIHLCLILLFFLFGNLCPVLAQDEKGVTTPVAGTPYMIRYSLTDNMNLSTTDPNLTGFTDTWVSLRPNNYSDDTQIFYFEDANDGNWYIKDADGKYLYYSSDWGVNLANTSQNNNNYKFALDTIANTPYVMLKGKRKSQYLTANRGLQNQTPVYGDATSKHFAGWTIIPYDPISHLKTRIAYAQALHDKASAGAGHNKLSDAEAKTELQTAINNAQSTVSNYESTAVTPNTSETEAARTAVTTAENTLDAAIETFRESYNSVKLHTRYKAIHYGDGQLLTFHKDNHAYTTTEPSTITSQYLIEFEKNGDDYYIKSNNQYLTLVQDVYTNNGNKPIIVNNNDNNYSKKAVWTASTTENKRALRIEQIDNTYTGIRFYSNNTSNFNYSNYPQEYYRNDVYLGVGNYLSNYGSSGGYYLFADKATGSKNTMSYWKLEPYEEDFIFHVINKAGNIAVTNTFTVRTSNLRDIKISIPDEISSNFASAYHFYLTQEDATKGTNELSSNTTYYTLSQANNNEIYVTYDMADQTLAEASNLNGTSTKIQVNGYYLYDNSGTTALSDTNSDDDAYKWKVSAQKYTINEKTYYDPYQITITNVSTTSNVLSLTTLDLTSSSSTIALATSGQQTWMLLKGSGDGSNRLMLSYPAGAYNYSLYNNSGSINAISNDKVSALAASHDDPSLQVTLGQVVSNITYVIVNNNSQESFRVTTDNFGALSLPSYLQSPLAKDYRYYTSLTDAQTDASSNGITRNNDLDANTVPTEGTTYYVRYTYNASNSAASDGSPIALDGSATYTIKDTYTGSGYKYTFYVPVNESTGVVSSETLENNSAYWVNVYENQNYDTEYYQWVFEGSDPYNITVRNYGLSTNDYYEGTQFFLSPVNSLSGLKNDKYHVYLWKDEIQSGSYPKTYNTWAYLSGDRMVTRYDNTSGYFRYMVNEYIKNGTPANMKSDLETSSAFSITKVADLVYRNYHIIDKTGQRVVSGKSQSMTLRVPDEIRSPLVETYHYYDISAFDYDEGTKKYTLNADATELSYVQDDIYVCYDAGDDIKLDGSAFYVFKYINASATPIYEEQEDLPKLGPNVVYYPYTNGKEGFNLYGTSKYEEIFAMGDNTRTRFLWYFTGGDPYRLKIYSHNTNPNLKYHAELDHHCYFYTDKIKAYDGSGNDLGTATRTILTTTDRTYHQPTEYMVLCSGDNCRLFTTDSLDLDDVTSLQKHMEVTSFEHQWLNAKKTKATEYDTDRSTSWHHLYGLNAASDGTETGYVNSASTNVTDFISDHRDGESGINEDHQHLWFQTVELGSDFQILTDVELEPVLHLLDNHGWEVAHWTMTDANKEKIKAYTSPMVSKYTWFYGTPSTDGKKSVLKELGYYKYKINSDYTGTDDPIVYTNVSSTLDVESDGFLDKTNKANRSTGEATTGYPFRTSPTDVDNYYVYASTIKPEYKSLTTSTTTPLFLVTQGDNLLGGRKDDTAEATLAKSKYFTISGSDTTFVANPDDDRTYWRIGRNDSIDVELGYVYGGSNGEGTKKTIEAAYVAAGKNGFDPYNVRFHNDLYGKYLTIPFSGNDLASSVPDESGTVALGDGTTVLSNLYRLNVTEQNTGTTFMYITDTSGNPKIVSRLDQNYALTGGSKIAEVSNSEDSQQSGLTPIKTYNCHVVDHQGNDVFATGAKAGLYISPNVQEPGLAPSVPKSIRSPLATDWRFYDNLISAQTDASNTRSAAEAGEASLGYKRYKLSSYSGTVATSTSYETLYARYNTDTEYDIEKTSYDVESGEREEGETYLMAFQNANFAYQEDTHDYVVTNESASTILYPECNGQSQFYLYNQETMDDQFAIGGNIRGRSLWFFTDGDPYRLRIMSRQTNAKSGVTTYGYFDSAAEAEDEGYRLRTTLTPTKSVTPDEKHDGTYYMVLPADGDNFKLVTSEPKGALNTIDQRTVTTLEHNWKYNPTVINSEYMSATTYQELGVYRHAGYIRGIWREANYDGSADKNKSRPYYSTVDMGDGGFKLIAKDLRPSVILVDNHGWQVKQWSTPKKITHEKGKNAVGTDTESQNIIAATLKYNSPMVKRYIWYQGFSAVGTSAKIKKATGYYKYEFSEDMDTIHTSTSLADYPDNLLTDNMQTGGDFYVIYEVDPVYQQENVNYMLEQNGKVGEYGIDMSYENSPAYTDYYTVTNAEGAILPTDGTTKTATDTTLVKAPDDALLWRLERNVNIDTEMGYVYGGSQGELDQDSLESQYEEQGRNGFDPYNIWIRNLAADAYATSQYDDEGNIKTGAGSVLLEKKPSVKATRDGTSHNILQITGATCMAVLDYQGRMRIIPRFEDDKIDGATGMKSKVAYCIHNLYEVQPASNVTQDSIDAQAMRLMPLVRYTYHVVNKNSEVAISNVKSVIPLSKNTKLQIPDVIRSPFIQETGFYSDYTCNSEITSPPLQDTEIWVKYDYDDTTEEVLDLSGDKYFQFINLYDGNNYIYNNKGGVYIATEPSTNNAYLWAPNATVTVNGSETIDPYQVTMTNYDDGTTIANKFIVLGGSADGQYELMGTSPTKTEDYDYYQIGSGGMSLGSATTGDANIQTKFAGIPLNVTYVVINLDGTQSIRHTAVNYGGDKPKIPELIKSVQVNYDQFKYWKSDGVTRGNAEANPTADTDFTKSTTTYTIPEGNAYGDDRFGYNGGNEIVYVTYTYDPTTLPDSVNFDISGLSKYNIRMEDSKHTKHYLGLDVDKVDDSNVWVNYIQAYENEDVEDKGNLSGNYANHYLWKLVPNKKGTTDPYNIRLMTCLSGKKGTSWFGGNDVYLASNDYTHRVDYQDNGNYGKFYSYIIVEGEDIGSDGHATYRLMCTNLDNTNTVYSGMQAVNTEVTPNCRIGRYMTSATASGNANYYIDLQLVPRDLINVEYYLKRKMVDDDYKKVAYVENVTTKTTIKMPTDWQRKYCNYTYKCHYTDGNTVYAADEITYANSTYTPTIYPVVINGDNEKETPTIRIYVDYEVIPYGDASGDGLPFKTLANTKAGMSSITSDMLDLSTYQKRVANKDKVYFMVLSVNDNYTGGSQLFLKRDTTGRVAWLDNEYQPHYNESYNVNEWSYSRCAETYREHDHDLFQDRSWLWAFAGDPYDMYIYNLNAVTEETYHEDTEYTAYEYHLSHGMTSKTLTKTANNKTTTEHVVDSPTYDEENDKYGWGLTEGKGKDSESTFSLVAGQIDAELAFDPTNGNGLLYWTMSSSTIDKATEVMLKSRDANTTSLHYNIKVLPYEPTKYEDVNMVIRRRDEVQEYLSGSKELNAMTTGVERMFYAASERQFAEGDVIEHKGEAGNDTEDDIDAIPFVLQRKFCHYSIYSNGYSSSSNIAEGVGNFTVQDKPFRLVNNDGTYTYYHTDGTTTYANEAAAREAGWPQTVYVRYDVTTDMFLKEAPADQDALNAMIEENDHVFFMDFVDLDEEEDPSYNTGHHAYFDEEATYKGVNGLSTSSPQEKYIWDKTNQKSVVDPDKYFNNCQFKTTSNRMDDAPENLKWYFVGDPYNLQVYNTQLLGYNLARFSEAETKYQFVWDCVHLVQPDVTENWIDNRVNVTYYKADGTADYTIANPKRGESFRKPFYWEVVPATTSRNDLSDAFALRFKDDNTQLSLRNVYYYLQHDKAPKRTYQDGNKTSWQVNLSYDEDNAIQTNGDFKGYHAANNQYTMIRLVQPSKVYVSAYKEATYTEQSLAAGNPVVVDELSEYFGVDEVLNDVPRHLKRKYVAYNDLYNTSTSSYGTGYSADFGQPLTDSKKYSSQDSEIISTLSDNYEATHKKNYNYIFKFRADYALDDITSDDIHMFTSTSDYDAGNLQWIDVKVGDYWLYYDKTQNNTTLVSSYNGKDYGEDGWNLGLKGLHWAFIGDPYDFTVVNRRRYEDDNKAGNQWLTAAKTVVNDYKSVADSVYWASQLSTYADRAAAVAASPANSDDYGYSNRGTANVGTTPLTNTRWGLVYAKTGDEDDYLIRTASIKDTTDDYQSGDDTNANETNNYWTLSAFTSGGETSFSAVPFSLTTATDDLVMSTINTAVAADDDDADNDCFDANVYVVNTSGETRVSKTNVELKYGDVIKALPYQLRRYGCEYTCYVLTKEGTKVPLTDFFEETLSGYSYKTFWELMKNGTATSTHFKTDDTNGLVNIYYEYTVDSETAEFFTSEDDAENEDFTWSNAYYQWTQTYQGTNVKVTTYKNVIDHYIYNTAGKVIGVVYRQEEVVTYKSGTISTDAYGWANTHTDETRVYGNETVQDDSDEQKWALVGDPYGFTMKNYAQYLNNSKSAVNYDDGSKQLTTSVSESQTLAWAMTNDSIPYLAIVDANGTIESFVTFNRVSNNQDLAAQYQYLYSTGSIDNTDPTGNTLNVDNVKPFRLTGLLNYAAYVIYHLVIGNVNQSAVTSDNYATYGLTSTEQVTGITRSAYKDLSASDKANYYVYDSYSYGDTENEIITNSIALHQNEITKYHAKNSAVAATSHRDVLTDIVPDNTVQQIGVGNTLTVPWYMRRQFCNYTMYQRDVLRSQVSNIQATNEAGEYMWQNTSTNEVAYTKNKKSPGDDWSAVYDVEWISVTKQKEADSVTPTADAKAVTNSNGTQITKLSSLHKNRMVLVDVVYTVDTNEFEFSGKDAKTTTNWYSMMSNITGDNLTAGSKTDQMLSFDYSHDIKSHANRQVHYTNDYLWTPEGDPYGFVLHNRYAVNNNITGNGADWSKTPSSEGTLPTDTTTTTILINSATHDTEKVSANVGTFDDDKVIQAAATGHNAVYEMFEGKYDNSFLMHPTAAAINANNNKFSSFYVVNNTTSNEAELQYISKLSEKQGEANCMWRLMATPEQLLPYFDHAGYVGGLKPAKAAQFANTSLYTTLVGYSDNPSTIDYSTMKSISTLVYTGTLNANGFTATNLVPMAQNYFRIEAFSEDPDKNAIEGKRFVSGYRFNSEIGNNVPLHLYETQETDAKYHTFGPLVTAVGSIDTRSLPDYNAFKSNIELLPVEYDPSSIFYFTPGETKQYTLGTQGLVVESDGTMNTSGGQSFYLDDIGGAAVTLRTASGTITGGYLGMNSGSRYAVSSSVTEMEDVADTLQTSKFLLQPVGIKEDWPYNQMPLRLEVLKGGKKQGTEIEDTHYYGSLYVPYDTRLSNTTDGAFTCTHTANTEDKTIVMSSVSQLNDMENPLFIPGEWPVVVRTDKPKTGVTYKDIYNADVAKKYVNLYLPNSSVTSLPENRAKILITGQYLDQTITPTGNVMVFGLPFVNTTDYEHNTSSSVGFYTNANWARETNPTYAAHGASKATSTERNNKYVYHNKIYYDYTAPASSRDFDFAMALFEDIEKDIPVDPEIEEEGETEEKSVPWPCDVYNLQGIRVARHETPETLRENNPSLGPGIYIFGRQKVLIK